MTCPACSKEVEPAESMEDVRGRVWHRACALEILGGAAGETPALTIEESKIEEPKQGKWKCRGCGYSADEKWLGRCPGCGIFYDIILNRIAPTNQKSTSITELAAKPERRISTKIDSVDEVLGGDEEHDKPGGLVVGATVALAGSPGSGKSTLCLRIGGNIASEKRIVFYVSTEEHAGDIAATAKRIGVTNPHIRVYGVDGLGGGSIENILLEIERQKPRVLIYDSLSKGYSENSAADIGSTTQSNAVLGAIYRYTKTANLASIATSQINNEGEVKGGVSIEHNCDGVLSFFPVMEDGEYCAADESAFRMLSIGKNRKGSSGKKAMFKMTEGGLIVVEPEAPKKAPRRRRFRD